jgi:hypothetical protein
MMVGTFVLTQLYEARCSRLVILASSDDKSLLKSVRESSAITGAFVFAKAPCFDLCLCDVTRRVDDGVWYEARVCWLRPLSGACQ